MSNQSPGRGERILTLVIDWILVLGLIYGLLSFVGLPAVLNVIFLGMLVGIVLIPVVYFKVIKWAIGMTLGRVIVIGLKRLYRRVRGSESTQQR